MEKIPTNSNDEEPEMTRRGFLTGAATMVGMTAGAGALNVLGAGSAEAAEEFTFSREDLETPMLEFPFKNKHEVKAWLNENGIGNINSIRNGIISAEPNQALTGDLSVISSHLNGVGNVHSIWLERDGSVKRINAPDGEALTGDLSGIYPDVQNMVNEKLNSAVPSAASDRASDRIILNEVLLEQLGGSREINQIYINNGKLEVLTMDGSTIELK